MTRTRVKLLETWRTRIFHHVTPPEVSSLLRPYLSLRLAASLIARPALLCVSIRCGHSPKQRHVLHIGAKDLGNMVKGRSVSPVRNIGYALVTSRCVDFMFLYMYIVVVLGASSNRFLIQEHIALAGRARVRYRWRVIAAIVSGRLQSISSLGAGLNMLRGGLNGFFHKSMAIAAVLIPKLAYRL